MQGAKRDYYEILGVARDATEEDVRRAFRKQAMEWHPDRNKSAEATDRFKEVNEAYQVLVDPEKRQFYDRFGHADVDGSAGGRGFDGVGFSAGFGDIFDAFFGGFDISRETGPRRGADLHHALTISFQDAAFGTESEFRVERHEMCESCKGSRCASGTSPSVCENCRGSGQIRRANSGFFGQFVQIVTCSVCRGEGKTIPNPCPTCEGRARVKQLRDLKVKLPPGIDDGMQLRMRGEGDAGLAGGPSGDVYITIAVVPHEFFRRQGDHLILEMTVNVAEATLGATLPIPLVDDQVHELKIPGGIQSGTILKLKGKGLPNVSHRRRGDLLVEVTVVTPRQLNQKTRGLFEELGQELGDKSAKKSHRDQSWISRFKGAIGTQKN